MPTAKLDVRYSDPEAGAVAWSVALARLARAELCWIVTVRPDGRPHATPVVPVVDGDRVCFHTGRREVKAANLQKNPHAAVLVGDTEWDHGLDVMVEGVASEVTDERMLRRIAGLYRERWDGRWRLDVEDGVAARDVAVFAIAPAKARAHAKGDPFGQTTYLFETGDTEGTRR